MEAIQAPIKLITLVALSGFISNGSFHNGILATNEPGGKIKQPVIFLILLFLAQNFNVFVNVEWESLSVFWTMSYGILCLLTLMVSLLVPIHHSLGRQGTSYRLDHQGVKLPVIRLGPVPPYDYLFSTPNVGRQLFSAPPFFDYLTQDVCVSENPAFDSQKGLNADDVFKAALKGASGCHLCQRQLMVNLLLPDEYQKVDFCGRPLINYEPWMPEAISRIGRIPCTCWSSPDKWTGPSIRDLFQLDMRNEMDDLKSVFKELLGRSEDLVECNRNAVKNPEDHVEILQKLAECKQILKRAVLPERVAGQQENELRMEESGESTEKKKEGLQEATDKPEPLPTGNLKLPSPDTEAPEEPEVVPELDEATCSMPIAEVPIESSLDKPVLETISQPPPPLEEPEDSLPTIIIDSRTNEAGQEVPKEPLNVQEVSALFPGDASKALMNTPIGGVIQAANGSFWRVLEKRWDSSDVRVGSIELPGESEKKILEDTELATSTVEDQDESVKMTEEKACGQNIGAMVVVAGFRNNRLSPAVFPLTFTLFTISCAMAVPQLLDNATLWFIQAFRIWKNMP